MENKKSKNVLLTIMGVLILFLIVVTICTIQNNVITGIGRLISLIFVALYGFLLYKKPHGNMLKYAMLLLAATLIINSAVYIANGATFAVFMIRLFEAAGIVYCSGRLNCIEQNKIILFIIEAISLINNVIGLFVRMNNGIVDGPLFIIRVFANSITLATLMIAYFVRYKEHKEAGLMDMPRQ